MPFIDSFMWNVAPSLSKLEEAIRDPSYAIGMRMRAAYFLKQAYINDPSTQELVLRCLSDGLSDERHGSLMRHEFAYVLGQLSDGRVSIKYVLIFFCWEERRFGCFWRPLLWKTQYLSFLPPFEIFLVLSSPGKSLTER